jgi:putative methylase
MRKARDLKEIESFLSDVEEYGPLAKGSQQWAWEQHSTPANKAAFIFHYIAHNYQLENEVCCDLGAGLGVLTVGLLVSGCKKAVAVEIDPKSCEALAQHLTEVEFEP